MSTVISIHMRNVAARDSLAQALYDHEMEIGGVQGMTWDQKCVDDPEIAMVYQCEAQSIIDRMAKAGWALVRQPGMEGLWVRPVEGAATPQHCIRVCEEGTKQ
jgi:hypothetical protein